MGLKFYHLICDNDIVKKVFNGSLTDQDFKDTNKKWADDFYCSSPYYLTYNAYLPSYKNHYSLRVDCSHMSICADIPLLIDLCDQVLDEGLQFSYKKSKDKLYEFIKKDNVLKYSDLLSSGDIAKAAMEYTNSVAVIGTISLNNIVCEILPATKKKKSRGSQISLVPEQ